MAPVLKMPTAITAGAVISGAYMGDKNNTVGASGSAHRREPSTARLPSAIFASQASENPIPANASRTRAGAFFGRVLTRVSHRRDGHQFRQLGARRQVHGKALSLNPPREFG
jgi:hypothetical protein